MDDILLGKSSLYKVPLRLINILDWGTSKMLWGICQRDSKKTNRYHIIRITEHVKDVANYELVRDSELIDGPSILYLCDNCGSPLGVLFSNCICGRCYSAQVPGESHEVLPVLECGLPTEIVMAHHRQPSDGTDSANRYEWLAPTDSKSQPAFNTM